MRIKELESFRDVRRKVRDHGAKTKKEIEEDLAWREYNRRRGYWVGTSTMRGIPADALQGGFDDE